MRKPWVMTQVFHLPGKYWLTKMGLGPHAHTGSCCLVSRHLSTSEVAISLKDGLLHKLPILLRVKNWSKSACHFRHCFQCPIYLIWQYFIWSVLRYTPWIPNEGAIRTFRPIHRCYCWSFHRHLSNMDFFLCTSSSWNQKEKEGLSLAVDDLWNDWIGSK